MLLLRNCPACGSGEIARGYRSKPLEFGARWDVYDCTDCRHGFINPQPSWDELSPYYHATYENYAADHDEARAPEVLRAAEQTGEVEGIRVVPGHRLLDVGCGTGAFVRLASKAGFQAEGVEPGSIAVERARALGTPVFLGTVEEFESQSDRRFDVIRSYHSLEHVDDPHRTLSSIRRLLTPDGYVWLAMPNAGSWPWRLLRERWWGTDLPRHLQQFNARSLVRCAERAGLELLSVATPSYPPHIAGCLRQWLREQLFVPQRLTMGIKLFERRVAPEIARRIEGRLDGEVIVAKFRAKPAPRAVSMAF